MKNDALPLSNGVFFSVPQRRPHEAASMDKVGEGHTALRWRIAPRLPARARLYAHAPPPMRACTRLQAQYDKHNAYHGIIRSLIGV